MMSFLNLKIFKNLIQNKKENTHRFVMKRWVVFLFVVAEHVELHAFLGNRLGCKTKMLVGKSCYASAARRAAKISYLHEIRLVNVLKSYRLLANGGGKRLKTDGASVVELYYRLKHSLVGRVKTKLVYFQRVKSGLR